MERVNSKAWKQAWNLSLTIILLMFPAIESDMFLWFIDPIRPGLFLSAESIPKQHFKSAINRY